MWYYLDNKKRKGPVSDVAMEHAFRAGSISANTKVWDKKKREWVSFSEVEFFRKISGKQTSSKSFATLLRKTRLFRAMLSVMFVFVIFTAYLSFERIAKYAEVFSGKISGIHEQVLTSEYSMRAILVGFIFLILVAVTAKMLYSWAFSITAVLNNINRDFKMNPNSAGTSFFIPFLNFVYPCMWMLKLYSATLELREKKIGPFDLFLISMWWFFTLLSLILFIVNLFSFSGSVESETFRSLFSLIIYADIVMAVACIFWIAIISRLLRLIAYFYRSKEVKNSAKA